jgi:hypothetical protein
VISDLDVSIPAVPRTEYDLYTGPRFGGDLAIALGLEMDRFADPAWVRMGRRNSRVSWEKLPDPGPYVRCQRSRNPDAPGGRMLLVHDSFAHELAPFLAEQFQEVVFVWDWSRGVYPQIIEGVSARLGHRRDWPSATSTAPVPTESVLRVRPLSF